MKNKRGAIQYNQLILWIIAIVVLFVVASFYFGLGEKLNIFVDKFGSIFRFGR